MNKTKRNSVIIITVLLVMLVALLASCTPDDGQSVISHKHTLERVAPKAATCTEDGNREYYYCSICNGTFADDEGRMVLSADRYIIPAKEHNVVKHSEKKASCSTTGVKEYYECRNCGLLFRDVDGMFQITAPATTPVTQHSLTKVEKKEPAGFAPGWEEHYACSNCSNLYKDAAALIKTTESEIKIAPDLSGFEYKIAFAPAANIESINGTNGANYISASYTTANGLPATQFTFAPGASYGMEVEAWIHSVVSQTMSNGINLRIPTFSGKERTLELTVTNNGNESISFRYYAESYGDKGGIEITVAPGETKDITFNVNPGSSIGCNYALKLLSNVTEETKVVINGFFHCEGEVNKISLYKNASVTEFKVGDKFSTKGLVVKAYGDQYDEVVISNYMTSIEEGYVFTAEDVGTHTVTVAYGEYTVTYDIVVK